MIFILILTFIITMLIYSIGNSLDDNNFLKDNISKTFALDIGLSSLLSFIYMGLSLPDHKGHWIMNSEYWIGHYGHDVHPIVTLIFVTALLYVLIQFIKKYKYNLR